MPGVIAKYHRHFMPRFGETLGTVKKGTRKRQAGYIKHLRRTEGHKKARATVIEAYRKHVASHNEGVRSKKVAAFRKANPADVHKSPRWRKRGGGKITVKSRPALPKNLVKKP